MLAVPILSRISENTNPDFDTDIHVKNKTVFAADHTVWAHTELGALAFTPEQACAFAVALQAVPVHLMEQQPREIRRVIEPGAPSFEEST